MLNDATVKLSLTITITANKFNDKDLQERQPDIWKYFVCSSLWTDILSVSTVVVHDDHYQETQLMRTGDAKHSIFYSLEGQNQMEKREWKEKGTVKVNGRDQ